MAERAGLLNRCTELICTESSNLSLSAFIFGYVNLFSYICIICSVRLTVRTPPFHGGDTGSIPVPSTKHTSQSVKPYLAVSVCLGKRKETAGTFSYHQCPSSSAGRASDL